jgi:hypothetical protein
VRAALAAALAVLAVASPAVADLADDASRIERLWAQRGARVERVPPIFVERGHARTIALAPAPATDAGCVTVVLLAARAVEIVAGPEEAPVESRSRSSGGAVVLARCGEDRAALARVRVEMGSARGVVEILVARSDGPLGGLGEILPERARGPLAPRGDPGAPLEPRPLSERTSRAERRARADGAFEVDRFTTHAELSGAGKIRLDLADGCHRLDVMGEVSTTVPHRPTDIDAEARDAVGHVLARDRAEVPDARLDFCLGEPGKVEVSFVGASGVVPVVITHARWVVPSRVPSRFGPRARAGFATALFRRHAPDPREPAIVSSLGVQGVTSIPFEVEPGRCYLAALAMIRGEARSVRLSAHIGDRAARDDLRERPEGAAVAFCSEGEVSARIEADVRGNPAWWTVAVWPMGAVSP